MPASRPLPPDTWTRGGPLIEKPDHPKGPEPGTDSERGQTTAEYALVILGAAAVALLVLAWATDTGMVSNLLDTVIRSVADKVT